MRKADLEQPRMGTAQHLPARRSLALLIAVIAFGFASAVAEQAATQKAPATAEKPAVRAHKKPAVAKMPAAITQSTPEQLAPKPPDWPATDQPADATVVWNSQGLRIDAANSSLQQILKEVSLTTGAQVSGLGADQRFFGTYGPGPAREVLSQLLDGSGYNVLLIGDQGQGTPRQIVLSKQPTGPAPVAANSPNQSSDDGGSADVEEPQQPQPPPPQQQPNTPAGFGPGAQPRTPQQILQEMQQRQQQIEMQQQQQQQRPPQ